MLQIKSLGSCCILFTCDLGKDSSLKLCRFSFDAFAISAIIAVVSSEQFRR